MTVATFVMVFAFLVLYNAKNVRPNITLKSPTGRSMPREPLSSGHRGSRGSALPHILLFIVKKVNSIVAGQNTGGKPLPIEQWEFVNSWEQTNIPVLASPTTLGHSQCLTNRLAVRLRTCLQAVVSNHTDKGDDSVDDCQCSEGRCHVASTFF